MRLAILSDTRIPTSHDVPGHGLGHIMLAIAEGLTGRGHDVTLFAGIGSAFDGKLVTKADEREFLSAEFAHYDAVLDGGHFHALGQQFPHLPVVNLSHDRETRPGKNAVFPSRSHRRWHGYTEQTGRVIYHGVTPPTPDPSPFHGEGNKPYYAYLSMFHQPKGPLMAAEAGRLAGVDVVFAGPTPPAPPPGVRYIGPLMGDEKWAFLSGAKALLYPTSIEAAGLVPLEAQSVGCPVLVTTYGGAAENISDGVTGFAARDTREMVEMIGRVGEISRETCRKWVEQNRSVDQMLDGYEKALTGVANGERW